MATLDPSLVRYGAYLFFAFILWLLPSSANFPPLFSIMCYVGAIVAFLYAANEGRGLGAGLTQAGKKQRAAQALNDHELAGRLFFAMEAMTRELEIEFSPQQLQALPAAQEPALDEQSQAYLNQITELSKEEGWISATIVKQRRRSFRGFSPDEIRDFFKDLENSGIGKTRGDGNSLEWIWHIEDHGK